MDAVRVALVNDYEVVARGVAEMLRTYRSRIHVVELDLNKQAYQWVRDEVSNLGPVSAGGSKGVVQGDVHVFANGTGRLPDHRR